MQREEAAIDWASAACPEGGKTRNVLKVLECLWVFTRGRTHMQPVRLLHPCKLVEVDTCKYVCACVCVSDARVQSKEARQRVGAAGEGIQPAQATCH